jgi:glycerol-1-phosphate dehydrogenase [NAD(P)+]
MTAVIGEAFACEECSAAEFLGDIGRPLVVCANEPPWRSFREREQANFPAPIAVLDSGDMDIGYLERSLLQLRDQCDGDALNDATVVGFGGGTALDTAKYIAWKLGRPLVQVPTITSVDAGFTDAVGVRIDGHVRYVGQVVPDVVVLDVPLIRSAPLHLNRAGIGDVLSCHTGLFDWQLAATHGHGHPWNDDLAALGRELLDELEAAAGDVGAVSDDGVRFLASAYRRIGAACAWAGHSRFEEGSEHFWAYCYEHRTGKHLVHGELIAFAVCALAHVQGHDPEWVRDLVVQARTRAHPDDLGIGADDFAWCLTNLAAFSRSQSLDIAVCDLRPVTEAQVAEAWNFVCSLPREASLKP